MCTHIHRPYTCWYVFKGLFVTYILSFMCLKFHLVESLKSYCPFCFLCLYCMVWDVFFKVWPIECIIYMYMLVNLTLPIIFALYQVQCNMYIFLCQALLNDISVDQLLTLTLWPRWPYCWHSILYFLFIIIIITILI